MIDKKELKIMFYYLEDAMDSYKDHGCNDTPDGLFKGWSAEEKLSLKNDFKIWYNSNHEWEYCEGDDFEVEWIPNYDLVNFLLHKNKSLYRD